MQQESNMDYMFDEILGRMVYTVMDWNIDLDKAVSIANQFKQLDAETQEYLLTRLTQLVDESNNELMEKQKNELH